MNFTDNWIKAAASRLPSSPKLIDELYNVIIQPDVDIEHLVNLVKMDITISSRILRMANSATYSRGEIIASLDDALTWIGAFQAYQLASITVTTRLCEQNLPMYKISATKLLANTIAMAVGMQTLAKHADLDPKVGYTLGLLNNLGIIVLQRMAFMHEIPAGAGNFATIEETLKWEKSTFNCTHNDIGAAVLKFWGMNTLFSAVIETNSLGENNNETQKWRELLKIAKKIVANTEFNLGASSDITEITQEHLEELDIIINDPEELQKEIERNTTQLCEKLHLTESTT